jgi:hypothetical protein
MLGRLRVTKRAGAQAIYILHLSLLVRIPKRNHGAFGADRPLNVYSAFDLRAAQNNMIVNVAVGPTWPRRSSHEQGYLEN